MTDRNGLKHPAHTAATGIRSRSYCTRKGGEDIDEHGDAGSADDSQHHVIVEGVSDLVVKQLCPPVQHLHLAGTTEAHVKHHVSAAVTVINVQ